MPSWLSSNHYDYKLIIFRAIGTPDYAADSSSANIAKLDGKQDDDQVREQFQQIMTELLLGQTLKSMRKTVGQAAYFNGGRAEEILPNNSINKSHII